MKISENLFLELVGLKMDREGQNTLGDHYGPVSYTHLIFKSAAGDGYAKSGSRTRFAVYE